MKLTSDEDLNYLLEEMIEALTELYSKPGAEAMVREYYTKFTDPAFCKTIGIPVQDHDFFFHESAPGMALRAHYYLGLHGDPNPRRFIEWRKEALNCG